MRTVFHVSHLDCASCSMVMEGICEDTPGVTKAEVNANKKILTVEHDPSVDAKKLAATLANEGYPVELAG